MFFRLVNLVFFPVLISGSPVQQNGGISARIIGGVQGLIKDFPYQVALEINGKISCGGVIVSESFVISAGHCIDGHDDDNLTIRVGSSLKNAGGNVYAVRNRFLHPKYKILPILPVIHTFFDGIDYDLSILKLEKPLTFGNGVQPIRLPESNEQLPNRTVLTISGWGSTSLRFFDIILRNTLYSPVLRSVQVYSYTTEECRKIYEASWLPLPINDRMICGNVPGGGHNACNGDSGGPVTHNGVVYGVVSWARDGCASSKYPTIYTRIAHPSLRGFIKKIAGI